MAESLKSLMQGVKWEAERNAIGAALRRTGWNRKAAARLLKVSYRTLLYKIEQYQMRAPQPYLSPLPAGEFSGYRRGQGQWEGQLTVSRKTIAEGMSAEGSAMTTKLADGGLSEWRRCC